MASTTSTIRVVFDGSVRGLQRAAAQAQRAISGVNKSTAMLVKPLAALAASGGAVQVIAGVAAAAQQLAPAALLLPGALLAGAAAFGVLKLATAGFADAVSAADPAAFAEATKDMAPAAVAAASALRDLKPQLTELKKSVQARFFADFAGDIRNVAGDYLPMLGKQLPEIAGEFNAMGRSVAYALTRPKAKNDVSVVLENTTKLLGNMRNALGHVTSGFLGLGSIGSTYLPRLGTAIDSATAKFKAWVDAGSDESAGGDGSIRRMIDGAIQGFKDLGAIVKNIGSIVGSVFRGLSGDVSSPLASLRELTTRLAEFFKSTEAQGPLQALGQTMRVVAEQFSGVLLAALKALGPIVEALAPIAQQLATSLGGILKDAIEKWGPPLARIIDQLGPQIQDALRATEALFRDVLIPAIQTGLEWLANGGLDRIKSFFLGMFWMINDAVISFAGLFSGLLTGIGSVLRALSWIPGPFQDSFRKAADSVFGARDEVDRFKATMEGVQSKTVELILRSNAQAEARAIQASINAVTGKTVSVTVNRSDQGGIGVNRGNGGTEYAGMRAEGGAVQPGRSYLVGERGPEIVSMGRSGYVTPTSALGGGTQVLEAHIEIGGEVVRVVRTELSNNNRATRQRVGAGAGRGR